MADARRGWLRRRRCGWLLVAGLVGCSAGLDWRQLRPPGWGLAFALPCRPASQVRQVPVAGGDLSLTLMACTAAEHTFAMASAEVGEPARVGPVLQALGASARANVQGRIATEQAAAVAGMTPQPAARHWRLQGRWPDGRPVQAQVLVFALGLRVFQATLIGPASDEAMARPFFDAIEVLR